MMKEEFKNGLVSHSILILVIAICIIPSIKWRIEAERYQKESERAYDAWLSQSRRIDSRNGWTAESYTTSTNTMYCVEGPSEKKNRRITGIKILDGTSGTFGTLPIRQ
jgi:hypothetical protein